MTNQTDNQVKPEVRTESEAPVRLQLRRNPALRWSVLLDPETVINKYESEIHPRRERTVEVQHHVSKIVAYAWRKVAERPSVFCQP